MFNKLMALVTILACSIALAETPSDMASLKGLTTLVVEMDGSLSSDTNQKRFKEEIEVTLRKAGLRVIPMRTLRERYAKGNHSIAILDVSADKTAERNIVVELHLKQTVVLERDTNIFVTVSTWSRFKYVDDATDVKEVHLDQIDSFINDWQAVNR